MGPHTGKYQVWHRVSKTRLHSLLGNVGWETCNHYKLRDEII